MGLFDWLRNLFRVEGSSSDHWIYARCNQCGEALKARVDLVHDLSVRYDENGKVAGYFTRKTLIGGGPCFNQIRVEVQFDQHHVAMGHSLDGGELLTESEYEQAVEQSRLS